MAQHTPSSSGEPITILKVRPQTEARLTVTSSAFRNDGAVPDRHSAYGDNKSPPLQWTAVPGALSYALVLEDPDSPGAEPFLHWVMWNIPGDVTALPEGLPRQPKLMQPQGAIQGFNTRGETGYFGPRPPDGDHPHRYHFQFFALSTQLDLAPDIPFKTLQNVLKGSVLAEGELIGLYQHRVH